MRCHKRPWKKRHKSELLSLCAVIMGIFYIFVWILPHILISTASTYSLYKENWNYYIFKIKSPALPLVGAPASLSWPWDFGSGRPPVPPRAPWPSPALLPKASASLYSPPRSHIRVLLSPQFLSRRMKCLTGCQPTNTLRSPSSESGNFAPAPAHRVPGELTSFLKKLLLGPLTSQLPITLSSCFHPTPGLWAPYQAFSFFSCHECIERYNCVVSLFSELLIQQIDFQMLNQLCTLGGDPTWS